jgi:hypothetical protein
MGNLEGVYFFRQTNVDPAGQGQRQTSPVIPVVDGRQRFTPVAGRIRQMRLPQLKISQGAKNAGPIDEVRWRQVTQRLRGIPFCLAQLIVEPGDETTQGRYPRQLARRIRCVLESQLRQVAVQMPAGCPAMEIGACSSADLCATLYRSIPQNLTVTSCLILPLPGEAYMFNRVKRNKRKKWLTLHLAWVPYHPEARKKDR